MALPITSYTCPQIKVFYDSHIKSMDGKTFSSLDWKSRHSILEIIQRLKQPQSPIRAKVSLNSLAKRIKKVDIHSTPSLFSLSSLITFITKTTEHRFLKAREACEGVMQERDQILIDMGRLGSRLQNLSEKIKDIDWVLNQDSDLIENYNSLVEKKIEDGSESVVELESRLQQTILAGFVSPIILHQDNIFYDESTPQKNLKASDRSVIIRDLLLDLPAKKGEGWLRRKFLEDKASIDHQIKELIHEMVDLTKKGRAIGLYTGLLRNASPNDKYSLQPTFPPHSTPSLDRTLRDLKEKRTIAKLSLRKREKRLIKYCNSWRTLQDLAPQEDEDLKVYLQKALNWLRALSDDQKREQVENTNPGEGSQPLKESDPLQEAKKIALLHLIGTLNISAIKGTLPIGFEYVKHTFNRISIDASQKDFKIKSKILKTEATIRDLEKQIDQLQFLKQIDLLSKRLDWLQKALDLLENLEPAERFPYLTSIEDSLRKMEYETPDPFDFSEEYPEMSRERIKISKIEPLAFREISEIFGSLLERIDSVKNNLQSDAELVKSVSIEKRVVQSVLEVTKTWTQLDLENIRAKISLDNRDPIRLELPHCLYNGENPFDFSPRDTEIQEVLAKLPSILDTNLLFILPRKESALLSKIIDLSQKNLKVILDETAESTYDNLLKYIRGEEAPPLNRLQVKIWEIWGWIFGCPLKKKVEEFLGRVIN